MDKREYLKIKSLIHNELKEPLQNNNIEKVFSIVKDPEERRVLLKLFSEIGINWLEYTSMIPANAFKGITGEITIPSNIKAIDRAAFNNCDLSRIIFDKKVQYESIDENTFVNCPNLVEVILPATTEHISINALDDALLAKSDFIIRFPKSIYDKFDGDIISGIDSISDEDLDKIGRHIKLNKEL